jgi:hypothetical protein
LRRQQWRAAAEEAVTAVAVVMAVAVECTAEEAVGFTAVA